MTRKDFELIADLLYEHKVVENVLAVENNVKAVFTIDDLAKAFADKLDATNPRFNEDIFISRATKNR